MTRRRASPRWPRALLSLAGAARGRRTCKIDAEHLRRARSRAHRSGRDDGPHRGARRASQGDRLTLYVGAAGGGVWKSRRRRHHVQAGLRQVHPVDRRDRDRPARPKTVWVGTGESWVRNSVSVGDGVYKTTDGGDNWQQDRARGTRAHRAHRDRPAATATRCSSRATGHLWNANPERGVYRTADGGKTWDSACCSSTTTPAAPTSRSIRRTPTSLYAAMWQFRRKPWSFTLRRPGQRRSTRAPTAATPGSGLANGLPTGDRSAASRVAVAPVAPERVYAVVEAKKTALYRSDDPGETWTETSSAPGMHRRGRSTSRTWSSIRKNPNRVYKPGLSSAVSDDGGADVRAGSAAACTATIHALWIDPTDPTSMVLRHRRRRVHLGGPRQHLALRRHACRSRSSTT